jgi:hypothetical protein
MGYGDRNSVFWLAAIGKERNRQISDENCSEEHDDGHTDGSIAMAAACYAIPPRMRVMEFTQPELWPWDVEDWKPLPSNRMRELIKAGALIVAELERIDRAEAAAAAEADLEAEGRRLETEVSEETMATVKEAHDRVAAMGEKLIGEEPTEKGRRGAIEHIKQVIQDAGPPVPHDLSQPVTIGLGPPRCFKSEHPNKPLIIDLSFVIDINLKTPAIRRALFDEMSKWELETYAQVSVEGALPEDPELLAEARRRQAHKKLCPVCKGTKVQQRGFDGNLKDGAGVPITGGCLTCDRTGEVST